MSSFTFIAIECSPCLFRKHFWNVKRLLLFGSLSASFDESFDEKYEFGQLHELRCSLTVQHGSPVQKRVDEVGVYRRREIKVFHHDYDIDVIFVGVPDGCLKEGHFVIHIVEVARQIDVLEVVILVGKFVRDFAEDDGFAAAFLAQKEDRCF